MTLRSVGPGFDSQSRKFFFFPFLAGLFLPYSFLIYWLVSIYSYFCPVTASRGVAINVFLVIEDYFRHWNCFLPFAVPMARMNMDWNLKNLGQLKNFFSGTIFNAMFCKNHQKNFYGYCSLIKFALYLLLNSIETFSAWVKPLAQNIH